MTPGNSPRPEDDELEECRAAVEERLGGFFQDSGELYAELLEAMRYSLLGGGKRVRAVLCVKFCEAAGGKAADALDAACAVEMLHAYSLIHDDLPCMDDDDMRRGKPSNHIMYGECTATLAGDALQAAAFETVLGGGSAAPPALRLETARILAQASGAYGMCGGQYLDTMCGGQSLCLDDLIELCNLKTGALISAAAQMGVAAAGGSPEQQSAAKEYGFAVGLAFQARDDLLDGISTPELMGKPAGSDAKNNKATFLTLLGEAECEAFIRGETNKAAAAIDGKFEETAFLKWLAIKLAHRNS